MVEMDFKPIDRSYGSIKKDLGKTTLKIT